MKKIINIIDKISGFHGWLAGVMMIAALILVIGEVYMRTALDKTLYITDEYSGYLMATLTFCGMAYTLRERGHIRIMILPHFVKGRPHIIFNIICYLIGIVFCAALTYFTYEFFWDSVANESRSMHVSETYLAIPQFFMPLGSMIMALQFLAELLKSIALLRGDAEGLHIMEETDELGR